MKRQTLILLALLHFQLSFGQEYIPMLGETNKWHEQHIGFGFSFTSSLSSDGSDTTINNYNYTIISGDEGNPSRNLVREDVLSKKTYYYNTHTQEEHLFYDFSLKVNDTITLSTTSPTKMTVSKVYDNDYASKKRRFIEFTNGAVWVEGIGSLTNFFDSHLSYDEGNAEQNLNCFIKNGQTIHQSITSKYLNKCSYETGGEFNSYPGIEYHTTFFNDKTTDFNLCDETADTTTYKTPEGLLLKGTPQGQSIFARLDESVKKRALYIYPLSSKKSEKVLLFDLTLNSQDTFSVINYEMNNLGLATVDTVIWHNGLAQSKDKEIQFHIITTGQKGAFKEGVGYTLIPSETCSSKVLSTNDVNLTNRITVSPNPSSEYINVKNIGTNEFSISLLTLNGHAVKNISNENQLNISDIQNGIYIIELKVDEQVARKKITIQH